MTTDHRRLSARAARMLTLPTDPWLSCEDCFAGLDRFVDALLTDPTTPGFLPMRIHLAGCAACAEEAESLLELVAEQDGVDPSAARRRLRAPD